MNSRAAVWGERIWTILLVLCFWAASDVAYAFFLGEALGYGILWILMLSIPCGLFQGIFKVWTLRRFTWIHVLVLLACVAVCMLVAMFLGGDNWRTVLEGAGYLLGFGALQAGQALGADLLVNCAWKFARVA